MNKSTSVSTDISFLSYNSTGWNKFKAQFVKDTVKSKGALILGMQEHFLLDENVFKLEDSLENFEAFTIPAFKSDLCISGGRPSGGLSLLYSKSIGHSVKRILVPNSKRVQGITLLNQGEKVLVINAYFPTDNRNNQNDELLTALHDITYLLDGHGEGSKVILMGDFNCDFSRNTHFVAIVREFITVNNLASVWSQFPCDFTFSHTRMINNVLSTSRSVIDHFFVYSEDLDNCIDAKPLHSSTSLSNHVPIFMNLKSTVHLNNTNSAKIPKRRVPLWKKAKNEHIYGYKRDLDQALNHINVPDAAVFCRNVNCRDDNHKDDIDSVSEDLMAAIEDAVFKNIPVNSAKAGKKNIPGWTTFIAPSKEDADFWNAVWLSSGREENTELHRLAKYTKYKYHRNIRKVKKFEDQLRQSSFLADCLDGKVQNILKEVKNLKGNSRKPASNIDGHTTPEDISQHFKTLYQDIFNVHNDKDEVKSFLEEISASLDESSLEVVDQITPELVEKIIQNIANEKNDPLFDFKSNSFKVGSDSLCQPLCDLIKAFIIHGHIPDIFLVCSLIPIIKDPRASSMSSSNYRLIAITSLILKLFDGILLALAGNDLKPSPMQFGFQAGQSTTMATWTLTETISYFTCRGGPVYLCLLDLTKAFDRVKLSELFRLLSERIPPILLRFIIFSYTHQQCSILWQNQRSEPLEISNGVRQGSIASPTFFNIYTDEIFQELKESGLGCVIKEQYYGIIGYADDLALIAPSRETLQRMLTKCEQFFNKRGIRISTNPNPKKSKTVGISFGSPGTPAPLVLYGDNIPFIHSHKHLGHLITDDENMREDMNTKVNQMIGKFHNLQQRVGHQAPEVMMTLVNTYLLSLYGSNLWDLASEESSRIDTQYNIMVRRVHNVPPDTHRYIVEHLSGGKHIRQKLMCRFKNFYRQLKNSGKEEVLQLMQLQQCDNRSIFGRNVAYLCRTCSSQSIESCDVHSLSIYPVPDNSGWKLPYISELIGVNEGLAEMSQFTSTEVKYILDCLCSN